MKPQTHATLGRYGVECEIGRGAMGVVYRARDPKIDRTVAIKTISLAGRDSAEYHDYRERFLNEARAAGCLSHPGIVTVFDADEDPDTHEPFIVMEYVAGRPLNAVLAESGGRLSSEKSLLLAIEIAQALDYAHAQGVVHGDIKPSNIVITSDGRAKIADFGVARFTHGFVTGKGAIFGSPAYMAPEQLNGGHPEARSDLFSLGVMLYSMLTGFRPFQGNSAETVCFKVMNSEPVPVTSFQADLPPGLDAIVSRAIAKEPADRYQSGAEMAEALYAFASRSSFLDDPVTVFARTENNRPRTKSQAPVSNAIFWRAMTIVFLTGILLASIQLARRFHDAENLLPPSFPAPAAPSVQKAAIVKPRMRSTAKKPSAVPVQTARLRVEILHHFESAKASVWIDDQLVLDQDLQGNDQRHPFLRAVEMNQTSSLEFAPGKHSLQVHVIAAGADFDQSQKLEATLSPGAQHILLINCDKRTIQVSLK